MATNYGLGNYVAPNRQNAGYPGYQQSTPASGAATSSAVTSAAPANACINSVKSLLQQANDQLEILDKYVSPDQVEDIVGRRVQEELANITREYQTHNTTLQDEVKQLRIDKQQLQQRHSDGTYTSRDVEGLKQKLAEAKREKEQSDNDKRVLRDDLRKTQDELNTTKTRLSEMMSGRLTDNNPNIADLSDMNRPTKLGERYNELYDNQWTEAFEFIEKWKKDEKETILVLKSILFDINKYCVDLANNQMTMIQDRMFFSKTWKSSGTTDHINKLLKDGRKVAAALVAEDVFKKYMIEMRQKTKGFTLTSSKLEPFRKECFEICWLMAVQDPPVVLGRDAGILDNFDTTLYKAYTQSGSKVDFVVWPPLYLSEGGAILAKGVAQGYQSEPRRTKSAAPRRSASPEAVSTTTTKEFGPVSKTSFSKTTFDTTGNTRPTDDRTGSQQAGNYQQQTVYPTSQIQAQPSAQYTAISKRSPTTDEIRWFYYYESKYGRGSSKGYMGQESYDACIEYVRTQYGYY